MNIANEIPVRRMDFEFPEDMNLVFIEDDPRLSYFFLGSWMMLPHLEPFLIRTIQEAMLQVKDPVLKEEMKRFCAQEGQHFRQHAKANEVIKQRHKSGPQLAALEQELSEQLKLWSVEKSLKFRLAYAEGFESMTAAGARTQMEVGMFDYMHEPIRSLMFWHIVEELEHRSVCYEAYEQIYGGYFYRLGVGLWAQNHYLKWCKRFADAMIESDPETIQRYETPNLKAKREQRTKEYVRNVLPKQIATYMPWYNPRSLALPAKFEVARSEFSIQAVSVQ